MKVEVSMCVLGTPGVCRRMGKIVGGTTAPALGILLMECAHCNKGKGTY